MLSFPHVAALVVVTVAAATDLRARRVPNWLTGSAALLGLLAGLWLGGPAGGLAAIEGLVLGLAVLLPVYLLRGIGAGDVKLAAALGALLGPAGFVPVALASALAGGVLSLLALALSGRLFGWATATLVRRRAPRLASGLKTPYAVAIAAGTYAIAARPLLGF